MKYIVDRIEGEYAVCEAEDMSMHNISLSQLPLGLKEGSRLIFENGLYIDDDKNADRRERINDLINKLWE